MEEIKNQTGIVQPNGILLLKEAVSLNTRVAEQISKEKHIPTVGWEKNNNDDEANFSMSKHAGYWALIWS